MIRLGAGDPPVSFRIPTRVDLAPGCLGRLPEVVASFPEVRRALLVVDQGLRATPWPAQAETLIRQAGPPVLIFDRVEPNPRDETVDQLGRWAREEGVGLVVGLGGGSVLDAAKAAALLIANGGRAEDYEGKNRYSRAPVPMVAVPTTCGTGSEVTWVAVVSHGGRRFKMSLKGETLFPRHALVDADLLATLPPRVVAWTGMDALTHALEAATCRAANPASDALAARAAALLIAHLRRAAADIAGDRAAREAVMAASTLAGMAFGNADVAAVHCLSESLGGLYDLPHGLANAVLLAPVLRYNLEAAEARLAELAAAALPDVPAAAPAREKAERLLAEVEALGRDLEIPSFASFDVPQGDYREIAERAVANNSNAANPREMGVEEYLEVLAGLASC